MGETYHENEQYIFIISSVRNLYAGVLLLFKSYLAEESCDSGYSLLKRDVEPRVVDGIVATAIMS